MLISILCQYLCIVVHFVYLSGVLKFFDSTVIRAIIMVSIQIYLINPSILLKCVNFITIEIIQCIWGNRKITIFRFKFYSNNYKVYF